MSEAVHAFFSQWDIYRLCIEHNTLFHREVGDILRRELQEQTGPFTFLDLACGDAEVTAAALREHVRQSERPEAAEQYLALAHAAGFPRGNILFTDPGNFYSLFRFKARAA